MKEKGEREIGKDNSPRKVIALSGVVTALLVGMALQEGWQLHQQKEWYREDIF